MTVYPRRNVKNYDKPHHEFRSIGDFLETRYIEPGIISIDGAFPIDIYYVPTGSATTVISFHAALSKAEITLPMFAGGKVTQDGPVNIIVISDPGLYAGHEHKIAWFAGTKNLPFQQQLPKIIDKLLVMASSHRTLFWGPSAGGFGALYYSKLFPESLAIAINPQTNIANFDLSQQRAYTQAAFGANTTDEHERVLSEQINSNLIDWYGGEVSNYILYLQNESDPHVEQHMEPFLKSLNDKSRIKVYIGNWGSGHVAPTPEEIRRIVSSFTLSEGTWGDLLQAY
ncbi:hypothetical protein [Glutamicibacter arilaitensis]|uniref:hypothetical protein n=1 Tax=Glutamicibacter arilaitensis TaxID=256701 RepID=UPI003FD4F012